MSDLLCPVSNLLCLKLVQKGSPANINVYNNMTFYSFKDITMQKKMVGLIHNYSIPH